MSRGGIKYWRNIIISKFNIKNYLKKERKELEYHQVL